MRRALTYKLYLAQLVQSANDYSTQQYTEQLIPTGVEGNSRVGDSQEVGDVIDHGKRRECCHGRTDKAS